MRTIDTSEASYGSIRELATEINAFLGRENILNQGIGKSKDIFLCHFMRHQYIYNPHFKKYARRIVIQPIDGTVIEPVHVKDLNKFDLIITPASVGKKIMERSGVSAKIEVVPNYFDVMDVIKIDTKVHRGVLPQFDDKFIFYHESSLQVRKNVGTMIAAYLRAFSDNDMTSGVHLVVKGIDENDFRRTAREAAELRKLYKTPAKISLMSSDFSMSMLRKIWSTIDCYVSFAHMEGFGIPLLRMAANHKPIVTLRSEISGYMDFLNDGNTYFVESKKCGLSKEAKLIYDTEKSHWEDVVSIDAAASVLKVVYKDYLDKNLKANKCQLTKFKKDIVMHRYGEIINNC